MFGQSRSKTTRPRLILSLFPRYNASAAANTLDSTERAALALPLFLHRPKSRRRKGQASHEGDSDDWPRPTTACCIQQERSVCLAFDPDPDSRLRMPPSDRSPPGTRPAGTIAFSAGVAADRNSVG